MLINKWKFLEKLENRVEMTHNGENMRDLRGIKGISTPITFFIILAHLFVTPQPTEIETG